MFEIDNLVLSEHARQRMHQRAIRPWMVEVALNYGETVFDGKGCVRHIVTDKSLENTPYEDERERLRGLCVVVSLSDGTIITVEWVYDLKRKYPRLDFPRSVKNSWRKKRSNQWTVRRRM